MNSRWWVVASLLCLVVGPWAYRMIGYALEEQTDLDRRRQEVE